MEIFVFSAEVELVMIKLESTNGAPLGTGRRGYCKVGKPDGCAGVQGLVNSKVVATRYGIQQSIRVVECSGQDGPDVRVLPAAK